MNADYTTVLFIINAQDFLFNCFIQFGVVIGLIVLVIAAKKYPKVLDKKKKLRDYLFANGSIRLYMLAYLNLNLFSALNIAEMRWQPGLKVVNLSNVFAVVVFVSTIVLPPIIIVYFWRTRENWTSEGF